MVIASAANFGRCHWIPIAKLDTLESEKIGLSCGFLVSVFHSSPSANLSNPLDTVTGFLCFVYFAFTLSGIRLTTCVAWIPGQTFFVKGFPKICLFCVDSVYTLSVIRLTTCVAWIPEQTIFRQLVSWTISLSSGFRSFAS